jgi:dihydrodipicolinate synthase/N-acetylneuraminate lyase
VSIMGNQIPFDLSGVFAALPTPYRPDGTPDTEKLYRILDFHLSRNVTRFCLGGVTGEYAASSFEERVSLFQNAARYLNGRAVLISGIGGEHRGQVEGLARAAADAGAIAALLPPPFYFQHDSRDLLEFLRIVAAELPLSVLFYNIPQFTSELNLDQVLRLIDSVPNVVGLKDSSGRPENLPLIRKAKASMSIAFLIGSDNLLLDSLQNGADGAISGLASACPELIFGLYESFTSGHIEKAQELQSLVNELITHITEFPPPWAIKLALEARGLELGTRSWPLGKRLTLKAQEFQAWFRKWVPKCENACEKTASR